MKEKELWRERILAALREALCEDGIDGALQADDLAAETPPKPEMGDIGFPLFPFARLFKKAPAVLAERIAAKLSSEEAFALGPYVNVRLARAAVTRRVLDGALDDGGAFFAAPAAADSGTPSRVMIEFSSPNTNKPLHLGHLRNDVLGESVSRILDAAGAEVYKVCIINDRGIHICKSMLAYQERGGGAPLKPPASRATALSATTTCSLTRSRKKTPGRKRERARCCENGKQGTRKRQPSGSG